ncbi:MAG: hypothetical protein ACR2GS_02020 [Thermomicrobiales bacterium]|jgi:hypothetical protein
MLDSFLRTNVLKPRRFAIEHQLASLLTDDDITTVYGARSDASATAPDGCTAEVVGDDLSESCPDKRIVNGAIPGKRDTPGANRSGGCCIPSVQGCGDYAAGDASGVP